MDPVDVFHLPDGTRFEVPAELDVYLDRLHHEFPDESVALEAFFAEVREAYLLGLLAYFRDQVSPRLAPLAALTLRQALDRRFHDPRLKLILTADAPHWGSPPCRTSFVFDAMLRLSYFLGNFYPEHGSQAFADELGRRLEELGGEILTSTRAERIRVADGRVAGVALETLRGPLAGRYAVDAEVVVSNADLLATVDELLPEAAVDPSYRAEVHRLRPTYPCFLSHIGLRGIPAARLAEVQGYYWRSWDADAMGRDALIGKIFVPTLYEPRLAPPGDQVVILQKVQELDYAGVADWAAHKRAVEDELFAHLCRVLPEAADAVAVRTSASAHTSWRFTHNARGAMLGWEMSPDQLGSGRPDVAGPLPGLWLVGHWTEPGGGVTPVLVSAQRAAQGILAGAVGAAPEAQGKSELQRVDLPFSKPSANRSRNS